MDDSCLMLVAPPRCVLKLVINFYVQNMQMCCIDEYIHWGGACWTSARFGGAWHVEASLHFLLHCQSSTSCHLSAGNCNTRPAERRPLCRFERTFLGEMKNFMSYFLFNFFHFFSVASRFFLLRRPSGRVRGQRPKLIMDESSKSQVASLRVASQRSAINIIFNSELPTFWRR